MESTQYTESFSYRSNDYTKIGDSCRLRRKSRTTNSTPADSHSSDCANTTTLSSRRELRSRNSNFDINSPPPQIINVQPVEAKTSRSLRQQSAVIESSLDNLSRQHKHRQRQDTKGLKWTALEKNGEISPYADISLLRKSEDAVKVTSSDSKVPGRHKHRSKVSRSAQARGHDMCNNCLQKSISRSTMDDLETIDLTTEEDLKAGLLFTREMQGSGDSPSVGLNHSNEGSKASSSSSTVSTSATYSDATVASTPNRCHSVESLILEDNFDATNKGDDDVVTQNGGEDAITKRYKSDCDRVRRDDSGTSISSDEIPQVKVVWTTPPSTSKKVWMQATLPIDAEAKPVPEKVNYDPEREELLNFFTRSGDGIVKEGRYDDVSGRVSKFFSERLDPETSTYIRSINLNQVLENLDEFILQPAAVGHDIQCRVTRDRKGVDRGLYPTYYLHLERPDGKKVLLLTGRKRKKSATSNYLISTDAADLSRDSSHYIGKVRSNLLGTQFTIYDNGMSCKQAGLMPQQTAGSQGQNAQLFREELAAVIYEPNVLGFKGPRKMKIIVPEMKNEAERREYRPEKEKDGILELFKQGELNEFFLLKNKTPIWNDDNQSFVLNFHGRVTQASVKNFQIIHEAKEDYVILQFGRIAADLFTMDYRYPLSALQAFAIVLTSFDNKLACE